MAATLTRLARTLPLPLFGSAQTAVSFTLAKSRALPRLLGWGVPLTIGGLWFVWPAVDDGWKIEMGLMSDPEAALKSAEESKGETKVELSEEQLTKVENAYKSHGGGESTEDDVVLAKAVGSGDFSELEKKWEEFNEKAIRPGEDDDEEDEDDDDDEDEDEEEDDEDEE